MTGWGSAVVGQMERCSGAGVKRYRTDETLDGKGLRGAVRLLGLPWSYALFMEVPWELYLMPKQLLVSKPLMATRKSYFYPLLQSLINEIN